MKIVKSLEYSGLLLRRVSGAICNEAKKQNGGFLSILLGTLGASVLRNTLKSKGIIRVWYASKDLQFNKRKEIIRSSYGFKGSLIKNFSLVSSFN